MSIKLNEELFTSEALDLAAKLETYCRENNVTHHTGMLALAVLVVAAMDDLRIDHSEEEVQDMFMSWMDLVTSYVSSEGEDP